MNMDNDDYRLFGAEMPERKPFFERPYAIPVISVALFVATYVGVYEGVKHLKEHCARPAIEAPSIEPRR